MQHVLLRHAASKTGGFDLDTALNNKVHLAQETGLHGKISAPGQSRGQVAYSAAPAALPSACRGTSNAEHALWSVCLACLQRLSYRLTGARGSALTDRRPTRGAGWRRRSAAPPPGSTPRLTVICSTRPLRPAL